MGASHHRERATLLFQYSDDRGPQFLGALVQDGWRKAMRDSVIQFLLSPDEDAVLVRVFRHFIRPSSSSVNSTKANRSASETHSPPRASHLVASQSHGLT
ncbi:MAG: hypothetical protein ACRC8S_06550 [Fimbriiglobus sp.]